jgi:hypothetical protein
MDLLNYLKEINRKKGDFMKVETYHEAEPEKQAAAAIVVTEYQQ